MTNTQQQEQPQSRPPLRYLTLGELLAMDATRAE
jgi:hypothetical protein